MKKRILFGIIFILGITATYTAISKDQPQGLTVDKGLTCKWATRETSSGWEAICISTGVGYSCTCGAVKPYLSTR
ncbi:MAG: hypothetical protein ACLFVR_00275 [Thiohalospira sp.]